MFPDQPAGRRVERVHAVVLADVHHAFVDDRRRFEIFRTGQMKDPFRLQLADVVGVDLLQQRMPLRVVRAGVQQIIIRIRIQQVLVGHLARYGGTEEQQQRSRQNVAHMSPHLIAKRQSPHCRKLSHAESGSEHRDDEVLDDVLDRASMVAPIFADRSGRGRDHRQIEARHDDDVLSAEAPRVIRLAVRPSPASTTRIRTRGR